MDFKVERESEQSRMTSKESIQKHYQEYGYASLCHCGLNFKDYMTLQRHIGAMEERQTFLSSGDYLPKKELVVKIEQLLSTLDWAIENIKGLESLRIPDEQRWRPISLARSEVMRVRDELSQISQAKSQGVK